VGRFANCAQHCYYLENEAAIITNVKSVYQIWWKRNKIIHKGLKANLGDKIHKKHVLRFAGLVKIWGLNSLSGIAEVANVEDIAYDIDEPNGSKSNEFCSA